MSEEQSPFLCIVLVIPASAEDRVIDWMMEHGGEPIEFALHAVAARGPLVRLQDTEERVRGFASRVEVKLVVERKQSQELISALRSLLSGVHGGLWSYPVEHFEGFA